MPARTTSSAPSGVKQKGLLVVCAPGHLLSHAVDYGERRACRGHWSATVPSLENQRCRTRKNACHSAPTSWRELYWAPVECKNSRFRHARHQPPADLARGVRARGMGMTSDPRHILQPVFLDSYISGLSGLLACSLIYRIGPMLWIYFSVLGWETISRIFLWEFQFYGHVS